MKVLGISCYYHDASASLVVDGKLVAAAQEERFSRIKHDTSFPELAIKYCMESQKINIEDIDYIGFYEKPLLKFERVLYQHIQYFPRSWKAFLSSMPGWFYTKLRVTHTIQKKLKYSGPILFIEHHLAHAASTYLWSPFKSAAIVTADGVGEWATTSIGKAERNVLQLIKELQFPHSLGLLYSAITAYLGFSVNNSEYKVMGMSAYGETNPKMNPYYTKLNKLLDVKADGSFHLNMDYFAYTFSERMMTEKLCQLLGGPARKASDEVLKRHYDIAAAVQIITEEVMIKIINHAHDLTKEENLVLAGGVGLNSLFNGKILSHTKFKNIWIQPDPGDGGTSAGVAAFIYFSLLKYPRKYGLDNIYLGSSFTDKELEKFCKLHKIKYSKFANENELLTTTARLIKDNSVVGWFQSGMEWGPRALGARSILANPCNPKMQEILNAKVKHRERFRPFAPVVCAEDYATYFQGDEPLPEPTDYMLMVYPIKKQWHKKIPSVTHVDGTGRLQTVRKNQNKLYYQLIKEFGKLTGISMLINTSFNIRGEPIVCTPEDAYRCMMGTGIDYLVIGNLLIKREDNPQDMWDSENLAND